MKSVKAANIQLKIRDAIQARWENHRGNQRQNRRKYEKKIPTTDLLGHDASEILW
jgi:hypothetical protein